MTTAQDAAHSATRQTRLLILIIGAFSLALVGGLIAMVFLVSDEVRVNAVGPITPAPGAERGGLVFKGTVGIWEIHGRQVTDAARQVHFLMELTGPTGQPAPATLELGLAIEQPESGLTPIALTPARVGPGRYTASAAVPAGGQWQLRITFPKITGVLRFHVDM